MDTKADLCSEPKQGYLDLADHPLPELPAVPDPDNEYEYEPSEPIDEAGEDPPRRPIPPHLKRLHEDLPPGKRYFSKAPPPIREESNGEDPALPERLSDEGVCDNEQPDQPAFLPEHDDEHRGGHKREAEEENDGQTEHPTKRTKVEYLACYYQKLEPLIAARQKKEVRFNELSKINQTKFRKAIEKEIKNNLSIGAYTILSQEESARV